MEKSKNTAGFSSDSLERTTLRKSEADEKNPSLIEAMKGKFADFKQKILPKQPAEDRTEEISQSQRMTRREAVKTIGKAAVLTPLVLAGAGKVQEVLAGENNPYYKHGVSEELNCMSEPYRIHDLPAAHVQRILRDMTDVEDESARERQKKTLKQHLRTESGNFRTRRNPLALAGNPYVRVRSESALHIEGNDDDTVIVTKGHAFKDKKLYDSMEITAYYYPDKSDKNLKGSITITPESYQREYHGIVEEIENPGTLRQEARELRKLLMGENPAIAEAEEMIENLDVNSDMVEIAETLARISDLSTRKDLAWMLLNKGESLLKSQVPKIQAGLANSPDQFGLGFHSLEDDPPKSASIYIMKGSVKPQIFTQPEQPYKENMSLRDMGEILAA